MSTACLKLTVYLGERARTSGGLVADALLDLYAERELRDSVLLRGTQGFGRGHQLRSDRLLTLSEDLPAVAVAIDTPPRIEGLLEEVKALVGHGLMTLEHAQTGPAVTSPTPEGQQKLTVHLGRHQQIAGKPAFVAVCELLQRAGLAGATALLGVDGTRNGARERARFFGANAGVPMLVVAVGSAESITGAIPELGAMLPDGLLTFEPVQVCKRDGVDLGPPPEPPPNLQTAAAGHVLAVSQRLTLVGSEAATHAGKPLHVELVRRLRRAGAAGATSLRGIWGFHGEHTPHGDRLLSLRRQAPLLTSLVDTPERIAELYPIFDELSAERGLLTCKTVTAMTVGAHGHWHGGLHLA